MNSNRARLALMATFVVAGSAFALEAMDWTTTDGKVYEDVKIVHLDADSVTILDEDGGARIPLAHLPPELQKKFGYDPAMAQAAADARAKAAAINAKELQAEMNLASEQRQAGRVKTPAPSAKSSVAVTSFPANSVFDPAELSMLMGMPDSADSVSKQNFASTDGATADSNQRAIRQATAVYVQKTSSTHHSMDEMTQSAAAMRPSLSDPAYHTMGHLVYMANQQGMGPDTSDPSHRTMSQAKAPDNQPATTGAVAPVSR